MPESLPWVIVGLGNPGAEYENTRHNAGFWVIDELCRRHGSSASWKEKNSALFLRVSIGGNVVYLAKPQSFMNLSGRPVAALLSFFKVPLTNLLVVHDELALDTAVLRLKLGGGSAGHNGIKSLVQCLGSDSFFRLRLGISHPRQQFPESSRHDVSAWVLGKPGSKEQELLQDAVRRAADSIEDVLCDGFVVAQQRLHQVTVG
ncbi:MAG: aminoacyl-tRNA hydrolase [bacterium]|nr:aminoacyl-tRNA hydrolase [bacterium]